MHYIIIKFNSNTYGPFRSKKLTTKDVYNIINIPLNGDYELYKFANLEHDELNIIRKKCDIDSQKYLESGIYIIEEKNKKFKYNYSFDNILKQSLEKKYNNRGNKLDLEDNTFESIRKDSYSKKNSKNNINSYMSNNTYESEINNQKHSYLNCSDTLKNRNSSIINGSEKNINTGNHKNSYISYRKNNKSNISNSRSQKNSIIGESENNINNNQKDSVINENEDNINNNTSQKNSIISECENTINNNQKDSIIHENENNINNNISQKNSVIGENNNNNTDRSFKELLINNVNENGSHSSINKLNNEIKNSSSLRLVPSNSEIKSNLSKTSSSSINKKELLKSKLDSMNNSNVNVLQEKSVNQPKMADNKLNNLSSIGQIKSGSINDYRRNSINNNNINNKTKDLIDKPYDYEELKKYVKDYLRKEQIEENIVINSKNNNINENIDYINDNNDIEKNYTFENSFEKNEIKESNKILSPIEEQENPIEINEYDNLSTIDEHESQCSDNNGEDLENFETDIDINDLSIDDTYEYKHKNNYHKYPQSKSKEHKYEDGHKSKKSDHRKLKYDDETYLYYLLNKKNYQNSLLHSVMSDIRNKYNFDSENHILSYIAMKKRIEKQDKIIPFSYNHSSSVHEYFINTDNIYKHKCSNPSEWKTRPTYLFREKVNDFLINYYKVYNKQKHQYNYHELYFDDIFSCTKKDRKFKENKIIIREEEKFKPSPIDFEKIIEDKYQRLIKIIFLNVINDKCLYKNEHLYILLNDIIDIIKENQLNSKIDFTKLKIQILSDYNIKNCNEKKKIQ